MLYGNLNDVYITEDLQEHTIHGYLMKLLKREGYDRVVFYSGAGNMGKFTLDAQSARLCINQTGENTQEQRQVRVRRGRFTGRQNRVPQHNDGQSGQNQDNDTAANNAEIVYSQKHMLEGFFRDELLSWLSDTERRTAMVFTNMWDFMSYTAADVKRSFGELMTGAWERGDRQRNLFLFLYNQELDDMCSFTNLASSMGISSLFVKGSSASPELRGERVLHVGLPQQDEIENMLNRLRVVGEDGVRLRFSYAAVPDMLKSLLYYSRAVSSKGEAEDLRFMKKRLLSYARNNDAELNADVIAELYDCEAEVRNPLEVLRTTEGWEKPYEVISGFVEEADIETERRRAAEEEAQTEEGANVYTLLRMGAKKPQLRGMRIPNFALLGNPGVGKSEIARLIGKILNECGILEIGHRVEVTKNDLVAEWVGGTAPKTMACIEKAEGGVLFIDEAHLLFEDGRSANSGANYSREAISTIVGAMTNPKHHFCLILAGYPDGVKKMIASDPGLSSRITEDNIIRIDDYAPELLEKIFKRSISDAGYELSPSVESKLSSYIETKYRTADKRTFGNARDTIGWARKVLQRAKRNHRDSNTVVEADFGNDAELLNKNKLDSKEAVFAEIDKYVGFGFMKNIIESLEDEIMEARSRGDAEVRIPHMIFAGRPGTGKTTAANLMSEFFANMDMTGSREPVIINGAQLNCADYADKINEAIDEACSRRALLFIDEAHNLIDSPVGQLALKSFLAPMTENKELTVVFALYSNRLKEFFDVDNGLKDRTRTVSFDDYNGEAMFEIFRRKISAEGYTMTDECEQNLRIVLDNIYITKDENFANARTVERLINDMHKRRRSRAKAEHIALGSAEYNILTAADIPERFADIISAASAANDIDAIMAEIESYIGWDGLKEELRKRARFMQIHKLNPEEEPKPECRHYFFTGAPGTGKTTASRLFARALAALGYTASLNYRKIGAKDLVAGYLGQTSMKTGEALEGARHGVLFIDEAYSLASSNGGEVDSFSKQAVDEIVAVIDDEDYRRDTCVIFAGYQQDMNNLLRVNEGLSSRVDRIEFADYSVDEAYAIFERFCANADRSIGEGVEERCRGIFERAKRERRFANGRSVRKLFDRAVENRANRIYEQGLRREDITYNALLAEDVPAYEELFAQ